jgi:hypothetical protein
MFQVTGLPSYGRLKYLETVVYQREAIIPEAVVIYQRFDDSISPEDSDEEGERDEEGEEDYYNC